MSQNRVRVASPKPPLPQRPSAKTKTQFKLHIGIDFGTDGSGLAYALPNGDVFIHNKWKSKKYGAINKPKTQILLKENGSFVAFGIDASDIYSSLDSETKQKWMLFERFKMALYDDDSDDDDNHHDHKNDGIIKENEEKNVTIEFPKFGSVTSGGSSKSNKSSKSSKSHKSNKSSHKHKSHKPHHKKRKRKKKIGIKKELTAMNGKKFPSERVFVEALKYLKSEAQKYFRKLRVKPKEDEIQWILTVPAIWDDNAKRQMREWAIKAGLVQENVENQFKIVYEPDCASLAIQHKIARAKKKNNTHNNKSATHAAQYSSQSMQNEANHNEESHFADYFFGKGQRYILIDAGGGTVDIAFHEILGDFGVKECHHPSGGPWGSCYIDDEFINIMEQIFTVSWMNEFKEEQPNVYTEMLMNFRMSKNKFCPNKATIDQYHNIRLPYDFLSFLEEKMEQENTFANASDLDIEEMVSLLVRKCQINNQNGLANFSEEFLSLHTSLWKYMFNIVIDPIVRHCKSLCNKKALMKNCHYMCLVGGLSSSSYFEQRIKEQFGEKSKFNLTIIKPERPILTVVEGAALFGITENYIRARVLAKTYGVEGALFLDEARSIKIPESHIETHKLYHPHHEKWRVTGIFCPIASKNDTIYTNQLLSRTTTRAHKNDSYVSVTIWCSKKQHPILTPSCTHLASLIIKFDGTDAKDSDLEIEFHFYDTLLRVFAYPKTQPHHKKEVELNYEIL